MLWSVPAAGAVNLAAMNHAEYIAGERPSLLMASWQETTMKCTVYDKKPQRYAQDNVTQWLIWNLSNNNKTPRELFWC